jgi:hypothetical protein
VDPLTGEVRPMKLFVAAMGASNHVFAQARASETIADWIGAHVDLFAFLGGVPMILGNGTGSEFRHPLGWAIVGGLLVSQVLTLFSTPVVYVYLDRMRRHFGAEGGHAAEPKGPVATAPAAAKALTIGDG